ncbi:LTA synthase family protein [Dyella acidiphila]|uniref:LTA synthase family protein n=1 Tax=Dyella acidiphila TaxID=2775866 RepID=A0ABR9G9I9_9GAMM|nr:LTA synthase family protein [Dyella acidiphila]MBE1160723.1 LTA synthase family protein [Dyella acidiphila]
MSFAIRHEITNRGVAFCWRLLGLIAASLLLVHHLDRTFHDALHPALLWRNAFPILLFALLLYGLCGRAMLTLLLSGALAALVYKINTLKLRNMDSPLTPGDVQLGHQVADHIGFFAHYTGYHTVSLIGEPLLMLVLAVVLWRVETPRYRPRWLTRLGLVVLSLGVFYALLHGLRPWRELYSDRDLTTYQQWNPVYSAQSLGMLAAFVRMYQDMQVRVPPPDKQQVAAFASHNAQEIEQRQTRALTQELPDIVVVQSEAFFDPGVLKHVEYGQYDPNYQRLAAGGITGSLTTPTYGGGTIRTEFETLTGYPMLAFPSVQYPYFGLAAGWMPTVPHRLQQFGYSTTLFHPYEAQFWNREQVMPELGFQHMYFQNSFKDAKYAGIYISDRSLFKRVLAYMDQDDSKPRYTMVITMENHGDWDRDPGDLAQVLREHPLPPGLSSQGQEEMTYYVSHLIHGDAALADFANKLLARPRWTLLLFYGDHLPALSAAYADLGFDDDKTAPEEHTRFMLLSNRPFNPAQPRQVNLAAYDLPGLLFDTAGLPEDGYLAIASTIRHAKVRKTLGNDFNYARLQFNAALMEVSCGRKLDTAGRCSP